MKNQNSAYEYLMRFSLGMRSPGRARVSSSVDPTLCFLSDWKIATSCFPGVRNHSERVFFPGFRSRHSFIWAFRVVSPFAGTFFCDIISLSGQSRWSSILLRENCKCPFFFVFFCSPPITDFLASNMLANPIQIGSYSNYIDQRSPNLSLKTWPPTMSTYPLRESLKKLLVDYKTGVGNETCRKGDLLNQGWWPLI